MTATEKSWIEGWLDVGRNDEGVGPFDWAWPENDDGD